MTDNIYDASDIISYIQSDLNRVVKHDVHTKTASILVGVSAYVPNCQLNLFLKGASSTGKTYNVVNVMHYFPKIDVRTLAGLSPKALVHDHGTRMNSRGEEINLDDKPRKPLKKNFKDDSKYDEALAKYEEAIKAWNKEVAESYVLIDLSNTIMVFIDSPERETLNHLKPILSHDEKEVTFKFVDKTQSGTMRTAKVVVRGWPATFFLSTDKKYVEEHATRGLTMTPEVSKEKIKAAQNVTAKKRAYPWQYEKDTPEERQIKKFLWEVREAFVNNDYSVVIPFASGWEELYPSDVPRDMRDFDHLTQLVSAIAALHIHKRVVMVHDGKKYVLASASDLKRAFDIFSTVFETTRTGTDAKIFEFYYSCVMGNYDVTVNWLTDAWNTHVATEGRSGEKRGTSTVRNWVQRLCLINYLQEVDNINDQRSHLYRPLVDEHPKLEDMFEKTLESKNQISLPLFLKEAFDSWRKNITIPVRWFKSKKISSGASIELVKITEEEVRDIICKI